MAGAFGANAHSYQISDTLPSTRVATDVVRYAAAPQSLLGPDTNLAG
jgi:hypothetical protein